MISTNMIVMLTVSNIGFAVLAAYFAYRHATTMAFLRGFQSGNQCGIEKGVLLARASLRVEMGKEDVSYEGIWRRIKTIKRHIKVGFGDTVVFQDDKLHELDALHVRDLLKSMLVAGAAVPSLLTSICTVSVSPCSVAH